MIAKIGRTRWVGGNDCDGHIKILKVTDKNDKEIPMDEFRQDVSDFIVYFEA